MATPKCVYPVCNAIFFSPPDFEEISGVSPHIALCSYANILIVHNFAAQTKHLLIFLNELIFPLYTSRRLPRSVVYQRPGWQIPCGTETRKCREHHSRIVSCQAAGRYSAADGGNNPDAVKIAIPFFKSKDVNYFNYLPKRAEDLLVATIRNRFDVELWTTLHKFTSIINRQDELIYAFMESHGIEINEKNWCTIAKRYQRKRTVYRINERVKKFRSNLKAKKR